MKDLNRKLTYSASNLDPPAQTHRDRQFDASIELGVRRLQRRLDDLDVGPSRVRWEHRLNLGTNPTDIPANYFVPASAPTGPTGPGAVPPNAGARAAAQQAKKKQTPNVKKLMYARKSLRDWLEELVSSSIFPMHHLSHTAVALRGPALTLSHLNQSRHTPPPSESRGQHPLGSSACLAATSVNTPVRSAASNRATWSVSIRMRGPEDVQSVTSSLRN
jgi:hypothetical protein